MRLSITILSLQATNSSEKVPVNVCSPRTEDIVNVVAGSALAYEPVTVHVVASSVRPWGREGWMEHPVNSLTTGAMETES